MNENDLKRSLYGKTLWWTTDRCGGHSLGVHGSTVKQVPQGLLGEMLLIWMLQVFPLVSVQVMVNRVMDDVWNSLSLATFWSTVMVGCSNNRPRG